MSDSYPIILSAGVVAGACSVSVDDNLCVRVLPHAENVFLCGLAYLSGSVKCNQAIYKLAWVNLKNFHIQSDMYRKHCSLQMEVSCSGSSNKVRFTMGVDSGDVGG